MRRTVRALPLSDLRAEALMAGLRRYGAVCVPNARLDERALCRLASRMTALQSATGSQLLLQTHPEGPLPGFSSLGIGRRIIAMIATSEPAPGTVSRVYDIPSRLAPLPGIPPHTRHVWAAGDLLVWDRDRLIHDLVRPQVGSKATHIAGQLRVPVAA